MTRVGSPAVCESTNRTECMTPNRPYFTLVNRGPAHEANETMASRKGRKGKRVRGEK